MPELTISQFPEILVATASILLDRCLRYDKIQDRLRCQIWIWLVIALSQNNLLTDSENTQDSLMIFQTWVHLVVFSNITSISLSSLRTIQKPLHNTTLLSPAAWLAMMSTLAPVRDPLLLSMQVFCLAIAVLWMTQWHLHRKQTLIGNNQL